MKKLSVLTMAIAAATLAACGGDNSPNKPNLCADVNVERCDQVIIPSSSSSSSSSIAPPVNNLLPFTERFEARDAVELFSSAYKSLLNPAVEDPNPAFFYATSGLMESRLASDAGRLTIGNARMSIGQDYLASGTHIDPNRAPADVKVNTTTAADDGQFPTTTTWGELDLSQPWKMSFCVEDWNHTGSTANNQLFMVYVDNNQSSKDSSIHGQYSLLMQTNVDKFTKGKRLEINVPGDIKSGGVSVDEVLENPGTNSSFLQIRVPSSANLTMSNLWVGYQNDTASEPAADTCQVGPIVSGWNVPLPPAAPVEVTLTTNNQSLRASWPATARATSYALAYSEQDDVESATIIQDITETSYVIGGLNNGMSYYVWVKAKNTSGESAWSESLQGVPEVPATPPEQVMDLRAYADDARAAISWTADSAATEYKVYRNTVNTFEGAELLETTANTFVRIRSLVNDTPYYIFVTGVNAVGEGEQGVVAVTPTKGQYLYSADFSINKEQFFSTDNSEVNAIPSPYTINAQSEQSIHYILGGEGTTNFVEVDGVRGLQFFNARFAIGQFAVANEDGGFTKAADTDTTNTPQGIFDLTNNYQICYTVIKKNAAGDFQIYLDNNTSSSGNSIHGAKSRIVHRPIADIPLNEEQCVVMRDNDHYGTATSFIQIRVPSNGAPDGVVLSSLRIEDLGTAPLKDDPVSSSSADSSISSSVSSSITSSEASSSSVSSEVSSSSSSSVISSSSVNSSEASSQSSNDGGSSSSQSSITWAPQASENLSFLGASTVVANHSLTANGLSVTATGGNLSTSVFDTYFVSQAVSTGNFRFSARLASVSGDTENLGNSYRFGLLAIAGKDPQDNYASIPAFADVGFYYGNAFTGSRANNKADNSRTRSDISGIGVGTYVAIEIYDDVGDPLKKRIRRLTSTDGETWAQANSTTDVKAVGGDSEWHLGIFAAPGTNNITFEFTDIKIEPL